MNCEICDTEVTGVSVRYKSDVRHCKKCFGTEKAKQYINSKHPKSDKTIDIAVTAQSDNLDYNTGISIAKFVSGVGWFFCVIAIFIILVALGNNKNFMLLAFAPGFSVFISGLILVIVGQATRALMDNANFSKQILDEMRKKS